MELTETVGRSVVTGHFFQKHEKARNDPSGVKRFFRRLSNETIGPSLATTQVVRSIDAGRRCTLANQLLKCTLGRLRRLDPT